jgi:hypothetical protein
MRKKKYYRQKQGSERSLPNGNLACSRGAGDTVDHRKQEERSAQPASSGAGLIEGKQECSEAEKKRYDKKHPAQSVEWTWMRDSF